MGCAWQDGVRVSSGRRGRGELLAGCTKGLLQRPLQQPSH